MQAFAFCILFLFLIKIQHWFSLTRFKRYGKWKTSASWCPIKLLPYLYRDILHVVPYVLISFVTFLLTNWDLQLKCSRRVPYGFSPRRVKTAAAHLANSKIAFSFPYFLAGVSSKNSRFASKSCDSNENGD